MKEIMAVITDSGDKQRTASIFTYGIQPQAFARELIDEANIVDGSVYAAYISYDYPNKRFIPVEFSFEVVAGELVIDSLKAI